MNLFRSGSNLKCETQQGHGTRQGQGVESGYPEVDPHWKGLTHAENTGSHVTQTAQQNIRCSSKGYSYCFCLQIFMHVQKTKNKKTQLVFKNYIVLIKETIRFFIRNRTATYRGNIPHSTSY